jgi:hypothetical protein
MQIKKTINLPKELLEEAVKLSGANTQTSAIVLALEEYVENKKRLKILNLKNSNLIKYPKNFLKQSRKR